MTKVLITGAGGYIGNSFAEYLRREPASYDVHQLGVRGGDWRERDFSSYHAVLHLAAMVHTKETGKNRPLFFQVNRDLACEVAEKAKESGVRHLIFMSTMAVYGRLTGEIGPDTLPEPQGAYGQSKYEAEIRLRDLADDHFVVTILRPPMVYGKNSRGNYARLRKLARWMPLFPKIDNQRSMLYIENLNAFLKHLIDRPAGGLFFPQNPDYVNTLNLVQLMAANQGRKIRTSRLLASLLKGGRSKTLKQLFGDLVYAKSMPPDASRFALCSFEESVRRSERG